MQLKFWQTFFSLHAPLATPLQTGPLPLVLWHGFGDWYNSPEMQAVATKIKQTIPHLYIHSVYLDKDAQADREAGFFGNVTSQIEIVCEQLKQVPELADGFNAMGFSQGYVEQCNDPPVRNLVTWGSQHNGIRCRSDDFLCHSAMRLAKFKLWSGWVRSHIVQAQYYRDPENLENFVQYSTWLARVNNEGIERNETYKKNISSLNKFVMIMFKDDGVVVPRVSSHFAEYNVTTQTVIPLRERLLYSEDWLGLKVLDNKGGLECLTVNGEHMQIIEFDLRRIVSEYLT